MAFPEMMVCSASTQPLLINNGTLSKASARPKPQRQTAASQSWPPFFSPSTQLEAAVAHVFYLLLPLN